MKKTILTCLMVAFSTLFSLAQDSAGLLEVGTVAPDLVSGGRVFSLEQFRGRCVVLHFWASWGMNVKEEMAKMKDLYNKYDIQGVEFVGVSYDTDKEALDKFLKKESIQWRTLCELKDWKEAQTVTDYRLSKLPTMYLLDMEGKVLLATDNIGKLGDMLKKLQKNQQLVAPDLKGEDHPTQFPGGLQALMKFLASNVHYPTIPERFRLEGKVVVSFVVEKDGKVSITDAKMAEFYDHFNSPKYEQLSDDRKKEIVEVGKRQLINEALRVAALMPDWIPAKRRGKDIRMTHTLPITFRLE